MKRKTNKCRLIAIFIFALLLIVPLKNVVAAPYTGLLSDAPLGTVIKDTNNWEHKTGDGYTGDGEVKPVEWVVVAKNHPGYPSNSVTLISKEIIGKHIFNSPADKQWENSDIREWLNDDFYNHFSSDFKNATVTSSVYNNEGNTDDKIFLPSATELGGDGGFHGSIIVTENCGVRPALNIKDDIYIKSNGELMWSDPPAATHSSFTVAEGSTYNGNVSGTNADSFSIESGPSYGTLTFNADGSFVYTAHRQPTLGFTDTDTFEFVANKAGVSDSQPATVTVTITPVNDAPVANPKNFSVNPGEQYSGTVTGTDIDGDALTFALVTPPAKGSLSLNPDGTFQYTAHSNSEGEDNFSFVANDGLADSAPATVTVTIVSYDFGGGVTGVLVDGTLTVTKTDPSGTGIMTDYTFLDTNKPVYDVPGISEVIIGGGVVQIGAYSFHKHLDFQQGIDHRIEGTVTIGDDVITIGDGAFNRNEITSVTMGNNVQSIGASAFGYNQITSLEIPDSVVEIKGGAFEINNIEHLIIPNSVTTIGAWAFNNNNLMQVTIPNSLETVTSHMFSANALSSVEIPASVENIENQAFDGNTLTQVKIGADVNIVAEQSMGLNLGFKQAYDNEGKKAGTYVWNASESKWERQVIAYSLTYNDNGSTGGTAPIDGNSPYISGTEVTVLDKTGGLVKDGYTFVGWNTEADGSGTNYAVGDKFNITQDTTLYAQWIVNAPIVNTSSFKVAGITDKAAVLVWEKATDEVTPQEELLYSVYYSTTPMTGLASVENATLYQADTVDIDHIVLEGLRFNREYHFGVVVINNAGNKSFMTTTATTSTGAPWTSIGEEGFTEDYINYTSLKIHEGVPYLAYSETYKDNEAVLVKYDVQEGWQMVGGGPFSSGAADVISLYITEDGTPYVAYRGYEYDYKAAVVKYSDADGWVYVGSPGFTGEQVSRLKLIVEEGVPFLSYSDNSTLHRATVKRYDAGTDTWVTLGSSDGYSPSNVGSLSMTIIDGTPYTAFQSLESPPNNRRLRIMKFENGFWQNVSTLGIESAFVDSGVSITSYDDGNNLLPMVAYGDFNKSGRTTVIKLDAATNSWINIGKLGFMPKNNGYHIHLINHQENYYLAHTGMSDRKVTVMNWNGGYWASVGQSDFSAGNTSDMVLAIDTSSGTPYVAYRDDGNGARATVMKFIPDTEPPYVEEISRHNPKSAQTSASSVVYRVKFNEIVVGVTVDDFKLYTTGNVTGAIATITKIDGKTYDVLVDSVTGTGTLRLDLIATGTAIEDTSGNLLVADFVNGQTYNIQPQSPSGGGGGSRTVTPSQPEQEDDTPPAIVIINNEEEEAGTETHKEENGKKVVEIAVDSDIVEAKIVKVLEEREEGAINIVEIPVTDTTSEIARVALTGDIVKQLEDNDFTVSVNRNNIQYNIPAKELAIETVAEKLGVSVLQLRAIEVAVQMSTIDDEVVQKYEEMARQRHNELIVSPVEFNIIARATKEDGSVETVSINRFNSFVERVLEIPGDVELSKITTGVVFDADGYYSHIPTEVFEKDGRLQAKLNSLTNSTYSVIWNPTTVDTVKDHWSEKAVNDMAARLIILDVDDFMPNKAINRGEFAAYIVRALGLYRGEHLLEGEKGIAIANEWGIVNGYPDGTFRPNATITREEAMTMYARAMDIVGLAELDNNRIAQFKDANELAPWAYDAARKTLSAGVFNGRTEDLIAPKGTFTHAEAATAIRNLLVEATLINR
ncbi:putative repeat protein (TIGR02543 family) [Desulfitispora alkaliphila]|uniref:leucine-rich repeat protein n=1 Tax=Desulfitispora alkaliphila TaxID=622674 RepID=UPI003D1BBBA2